MGIVAGIIVSLGLIALIVPGIILAIMFLPVLPVVMIENQGVIGSATRVAPPQMSQAPVATSPTIQTGMKFCPSCGTQLASTAMFCAKCGAKQPT